MTLACKEPARGTFSGGSNCSMADEVHVADNFRCVPLHGISLFFILVNLPQIFQWCKELAADEESQWRATGELPIAAVPYCCHKVATMHFICL